MEIIYLFLYKNIYIIIYYNEVCQKRNLILTIIKDSPPFALQNSYALKKKKNNILNIGVRCLVIEILEVETHSNYMDHKTQWTFGILKPPSMGFSRQGYWSGLPFPSPGDLPDPGIEPGSPAFQADALTSEPPGKPLKT